MGAETGAESGDLSRTRVVLISPCRDEEATLERTIASMVAQTVRPTRWVVVDDGSTDRTPDILREASGRIPWLRVVRRSDRGFRQVGKGVVDAFNAGLESLDETERRFDFIGKVDVDIEFAPDYLERLLRKFQDDEELGAASGKLFHRRGEKLVEHRVIDESVLGHFKLYRREAFEKIGGFVPEVMWDGIDFHRARMAGYRTRSFHDPELRIVELRPMGSSEGNVLKGRLRWGQGQWFMGSAFPYVLASGISRMLEYPRVIGGLLLIAGYLQAAVQRRPRYEDPEFRRELRRWQYARLGELLRGRIPA